MPLNPGDIVNGRYEVNQRLGRGGFGITYTAYDTLRSPLTVVIKQICLITTDNSSRENNNRRMIIRLLERETTVFVNKLKHACIPDFIESFEEDDYYYMTHEYIEGHDLSHEICSGEPISELEAVNILRETLVVLQFLHQNHVIHRNIKPTNIIRRRDNKLVLINFGSFNEIAEYIHSHTTIYDEPTRIYSKGYTAPEQMIGNPKLNSDIYALGMVLMQAVTGFSIDDICNPDNTPVIDSRGNYIWQEYAPQISPKLKRIISKMIEYSCRDRYQTVDEVLSAINEVSLWEEIKQGLINIFTQHQKLIKFMAFAIAACCLLILLTK